MDALRFIKFYAIILIMMFLSVDLAAQERDLSYFNCFGSHFQTNLSHYGTKVGYVNGSYQKVVEGTCFFNDVSFRDLDKIDISSAAANMNYRRMILNPEGYIIDQCFSSSESFDTCSTTKYSLDDSGKLLGWRREFLDSDSEPYEMELIHTYNSMGYLENEILVGSHLFQVIYTYDHNDIPTEIEIVGETATSEYYTIQIDNIVKNDQMLTFTKRLISCENCNHQRESLYNYSAEFYFDYDDNVIRSVEIRPNGKKTENQYQYIDGKMTRSEFHDRSGVKTVIQYFYEQNRMIRRLITRTTRTNNSSPPRIKVYEFLYKEHNENDDWTKEERRNLKTGELDAVVIRIFE